MCGMCGIVWYCIIWFTREDWHGYNITLTLITRDNAAPDTGSNARLSAAKSHRVRRAFFQQKKRVNLLTLTL